MKIMDCMASEKSKYYDKRSEFFRRYFEQALPYNEYVLTGTSEQQEKWRNFETAVGLRADQLSVLKSFVRKLNVLVLSGLWCGDCARQGPMLHKLETVSPTFNFRFIDNRANPELQEELRINGAEKVPVVVGLSEDFYELERFGDRHLSVYRRKLQTELGAACDPGIVTGSEGELTAELTEWISFFERLQALLRLAPLLRARYGD